MAGVIAFHYEKEVDLLRAILPFKTDRIGSCATIFPFSSEIGIPAASFVAFVGMDEETEEITGELVGFEMPFFEATFPRIRDALMVRFNTAVPALVVGEGVVQLEDPAAGDWSYVDEDIKRDGDTVALFSCLVEILSDVYFRITARPQVIPSTERIEKNSVKADLILC